MGSRYTQRQDIRVRPPEKRRSQYSEGGFDVRPGEKHRDSATFSIAIMAHKKRERWVPYLQELLPSAEVVWDRHNDRHETGLRSIMSYDPAADYHLVVQDDAILSEDFWEGLNEAIKYVPGGLPVGLYHGRTGNHNDAGVKRAVKEGACWVARSGPVWGPAIVMPAETISDLSKFYQSIPHVPNYDRRILKYYKSAGKQCFYPVPSLVDHRTEDNPSLASPQRTGFRHALRFVGPHSALSVDWSGPVVWAQNL